MSLTLQTRIRDAELSVRTANALCSMYGENVKFEHFVDPGPDEQQMIRTIGRKGLKEFKEVLDYAITGSLVLSGPRGGSIVPNAQAKTLRDEFAMAALTGMCASSVMEASNKQHAEVAYALADAMMEARGR